MSEPTIEQLQAENTALRQRVAELEATALELERFKTLLNTVPDGIAMTDATGTIRYANPALHSLAGAEALIGGTMIDFYDPAERTRIEREIIPEMIARGSWRGQVQLRRPNGEVRQIEVNVMVLFDDDGTMVGQAGIMRDLTNQQHAEHERLTLQQQVIDAQQAALRELSTPLIPLSDGVVALPLVGAIDSARAAQIMETLLEGIGAQQAETAILDITGVRVVDTQVANALLRAAKAAQLLGAQVVLTGISAEVAQSLVGLGADLGNVVTRSNLQSGIAYALEQRGNLVYTR